jgi:surface polysaccharide O-acyltransferase-like enzyme
MTTSTGRRFYYIDMLRVTAAFCIVLFHVMAEPWNAQPIPTWQWQMYNFVNCLLYWPVPVFFMISGMLHLQSTGAIVLAIERKRVFKKTFRILCALLFWGIVYNIVYPIVMDNTVPTFHNIIRIPNKIISGDSRIHFWFLYTLIPLYLITPLVKQFVHSSGKNYLEYFFILCLIHSGIRLYNIFNAQLFNIPFLPLRIAAVFTGEISISAGYYLAGYYFSKYPVTSRQKHSIYALGIVSLFFTVLGTSHISRIQNKPVGCVYIDLPVIFQTCAVFLFIRDICERRTFSGRFQKLIAFLGKYSMGIYLVQIFVIEFLRKLGLGTFSFLPVLSIPASAVLAFILSFLISTALGQIPVLRKYIV